MFPDANDGEGIFQGMNFLGSALRWSVLSGALLFVFPAVSAEQTPTHRAPAQYGVMQSGAVVTYPPALVRKGKEVFQQDCSFCHGRDAGGGETGPDLTRSRLVNEDVGGDKIGAVVRSGRPDKGMPRFDLSDEETASLAAFIHTQKNNAVAKKGARRGVEVSDLQTGNAGAGKRYFDGAGGCAACHSPTGDLAGIASRYQGLELEQKMLFPKRAKSRVTVTLASGQTVTGTLDYLDEFTVGMIDSTGSYRSWSTGNVQYKVDSPVNAHVELLSRYSDADIHDLMAYLQTLR
jgi:cytochrome c oxidase cbb3-type subunit 3